MRTTGMNNNCCSFCDSVNMSMVMDFGEVALAGAFLKTEQFDSERKFPQRLYFCHDCYAVQIVDKIPADVLFQNHYFYFLYFQLYCIVVIHESTH